MSKNTLFLVERTLSGVLVKRRIGTDKLVLSVQPGSVYAIIDEETQKPPKKYALKRLGKSLLVDHDSNGDAGSGVTVVEIQDYYSEKGAYFATDGQFDAASQKLIDEQSPPLAKSTAENIVIWTPEDDGAVLWWSNQNAGLLGIGALGAGIALSDNSSGSSTPDRGVPPAPTLVQLDSSDNGDPSDGFSVRVGFDPGKLKAGDKILLNVYGDPDGDGVVTLVDVVEYVVNSADLTRGFAILETGAPSAGGSWGDGKYSAEASIQYLGGKTGPELAKDLIFTVLDGVVHDDWIASAAVFVDFNFNGQWDDGEPFTYTDQEGRFTFAFDPGAAPILAVGGVDTSSGRPNDGVVFQALPGLVDPTNDGVDFVLSNLTTVIATVARQLSAQQGGSANALPNNELLAQAASVVSNALGLSLRDATVLLRTDAVAQAGSANATDLDKDVLTANRQLSLLVSSSSALLRGAASSGQATENDFIKASSYVTDALASLIVERQASNEVIRLGSGADIEQVLTTAIQNSNNAGFTQELRATQTADLTQVAAVLAAYNTQIDAATSANPQSAEAQNLLRSAANTLLPVLQEAGIDASRERGGDISLSQSLKQVTELVTNNLPLLTGGQFITQRANGFVGDYVPLDFQMPTLGVGDSIDYFVLHGLPPQVELFVVDPRTREVTKISSTELVIDGDGNGSSETVTAFLVPIDKAGFLAVRVALGTDIVTTGDNTRSIGPDGKQDDAIDYSASIADDVNAIWLFGENRYDASGAALTEVQVFRQQLQLNIIQRSTAPRVSGLGLYDDNDTVSASDDSVVVQRGVTNDATPRLGFKVTLPSGGRINIYLDGSNTPLDLSDPNNGVLSGGPDTDGLYSFTPSPLRDGQHNFVVETVNGTDTYRTTPRIFTIDTSVLPPTIDPTDGTVVRGTGEPGATLVVYDKDGQEIGQTTVDEKGNWEFQPSTPIVDGSKITAKQTDPAGNTSGPSGEQTVDALAPSQKVTITQVLDDVAGATGALAQGTSGSPTPTNDPTPNISGTLSALLGQGEQLVVRIVKGGTTYQYTLTADDFSSDGKSWTLPVSARDPDNAVDPVSLTDGQWRVYGVVERVVGSSTKSGSESNSYYLEIDTKLAGKPASDLSGPNTADYPTDTSTLSGDAGDGGDPGTQPVTVTAFDDKGTRKGTISDDASFRTDDAQPTFSGTLPGGLILSAKEYVSAYAIKLKPDGTPLINADGSYTYIPLGKTQAKSDGTWSLEPSYALPDGPQKIVFFIEDIAGNRSKPIYEPYDFTVDTSSRVSGPSGVDGGDGSPGSPYYILEGTDGSRSLVFTVSRGDSYYNQTMDWQLSGMDPADVAGELSGKVTFAAGELTKLVTVAVLGDKNIEADETLTFTIDNGRDESQSVVVRNDDSLLSISTAQSSVVEGNPGETRALVYKISRQNGLSGTSVDWSVDGGSSDGITSATSGSVSFAAGELEKFVTVQVAGDLAIETGEHVSVSLHGPGINATIGLATAKVDLINDDLGVSVIAPPNSEIAEGGNYVFSLVRSDITTGASVNYTVAGIGANPAYGADFFGGSLPGGTVSFAEGTGTILVTVQIAGDSVVEPNEQFGIVLSNPVNTTILNGQIQGTIVNDDVGYSIESMQGGSVLPSAQTLMSLASTLEGTGTGGQQVFKIVRTGNTIAVGEVDYSISGFADNGTVDGDFYNALVSGTVSFAANQTEVFITVNLSGDAELEGYENYKIELSTSEDNVQIVRGTALATVNPDDSGISIEAVNAMAFEDGGGLHTFNIFRTGYLGGTSVVHWAVQGKGANSVDKYDFGGELPSGLITFAAGESVLTISFAPSADVVLEADEAYKVVLSTNQPGVVLLQAEAEGLLVNDELGLRFSSSSAASLSSNEGAGNNSEDIAFTVERLGNLRALNRESVFRWELVHNQTSSDDFATGAPSTGLVTFAPGETAKSVSIGLSGDNQIESNKGFSIKITSLTTGTEVIGGVDTIDGTIVNDDAQFALQALSSIKEGDSGATLVVMTVTRTGDLSSTDTVDYAVELPEGSTASADDFAGGGLPQGQVVFAANIGTMQLTFALATDSVLEADETFSVVLGNNSANTNILESASSRVVTITNDDDLVSIVATDASKSEGGASGASSFVFTAVREAGSATDKATVLSWTTVGLGANVADRAGTDDFTGYSGAMPSGTVTIASGATMQSFTIHVAGDNDYEPDQGFRVTLTSPSATSGTALKTASADGLIINDDTGISIAATTTNLTEGDSGTQAHVFTISRYGVVSGSTTVQWAVSGDVNADDFGGTLPGGTVTFAPNETVQTITLLASGDVSIENNESFVVTLSNASANGDIDVATANGQIVADDVSITLFSHPAATVTEGASSDQALDYVVTRSGDMASTVVVNWAVTGAVDASDFRSGSALSGKVTFAAGQDSQTVRLYLNGDNQLESNEDLIFTLSSNGTDNPANSRTYIQTASATTSVVNDDASLTPTALVSAQSEGDASTTPFVFSVTPSGVLGASSVVKWYVTSSAADVTDFAAGQDAVGDYSGFPSGYVTFAAGQTVAALITVNVKGDTDAEGNELFTVNLSTTAPNVEIPTATVSATITNDDTAYSVVAVSTDKAEGNTGTNDFVFNVVRTGVLTDGAVVNWGVTGSGTHQANAADFVGSALPGGAVTFGLTETTKTVTVQVAGDLDVENDEGFTFTISGAPAPIVTSTATGLIRNEDQQFSVALNGNASVAEGDSGTKSLIYTVSRVGDTSGQATVQYAVVGGAGVTSDDHVGNLPTGVITFGPNNASQLVTVTLAGDNLSEGDETYTLTLSSPSTGTLNGSATAATYTVTNDDLAIEVVAPSAAAEGSTAGNYTHFVFAINRSGIPSSQNTVLDWKVQSSEVNASDFRSGQDALSLGLPSGRVTFTGTQTQILLTIDVAQDARPELDESFSLVVENNQAGQTNVELRTASASTTILNDDSGFAIDVVGTGKAAEGSATGHVFALTRNGQLASAATLDWLVSAADSGNVANSADFAGVFPGGTVTFGVSETVKYITIVSSQDAVAEFSEDFKVTVSNPTIGGVAQNANTIANVSAVGTIVNDDQNFNAASTATFAEGDSGTKLIVFTVNRVGDGLTNSVATVAYAVSASGAVADEDYVGPLPSGTLTFAENELSKSVTMTLKGDTVVESGESYTITLSSPSIGSTIGTATATTTITDDDTNYVLVAPSDVHEGHTGETTNVVFAVNRTGIATQAGSVHWAVQGTSDLNNADFVSGTLPSGDLSFTAGATQAFITLAVKGDVLLESDETIRVLLSSPTGGSISGTDGDKSMTLLSDDDSFSISTTTAKVFEGHTGANPTVVYAINRTGSLDFDRVIDYAITGTGIDSSDLLTPLTDHITFAAGATQVLLTVQIQADTVTEGDETMTVTLSTTEKNTVFGAGLDSAQTEITNDDAKFKIETLFTPAAEGNTSGQALDHVFLVTRSGYLNQSNTVSWSLVTSGVTNSVDPATDDLTGSTSGSLYFGISETTKTVTIRVLSDSYKEENEVVRIQLASPSTGSELDVAKTTADSTVSNDDAEVNITSGTSSLSEGDGGFAGTAFTYTLTRTGKVDQTSVVNWSVSGVSEDGLDAAEPTDFSNGSNSWAAGSYVNSAGFPSGAVTFASGVTEAIVTVYVRGDTAADSQFDSWYGSNRNQGSTEADETFRFSLTGPANSANTGTTIGANSSKDSTILNDDTRLTITVNDYSQPEKTSTGGTTDFVYTVTRTGVSSGTTTVNWAVTNGNTDATDFTGSTSGSLTFLATETLKYITVKAQGDDTVENNEYFNLTLSGGSGYDEIDAAGYGSTGLGTTGSVYTVIERDEAIFGVEGGSWYSSSNYDPFSGSATEGDTTADAAKLNNTVVGGDQPFVFSVFRDISTAGDAWVKWYVINNSGVDGSDFVSGQNANNVLNAFASGTLSFADGQSRAYVTIMVKADDVSELDESFRFQLDTTITGVSSGSSVGSKYGTYADYVTKTIINDDTVFATSLDTGRVTEGQNIVYHIDRTIDTRGQDILNWSIAIPGSEATNESNTVQSTWYKLDPSDLTRIDVESGGSATFAGKDWSTDWSDGGITYTASTRTLSGTLTFTDSDGRVYVTLGTANDSLTETWYEQSPTMTISLPVSSANGSGANGFDQETARIASGYATTGSTMVLDNEPEPVLKVHVVTGLATNNGVVDSLWEGTDATSGSATNNGSTVTFAIDRTWDATLRDGQSNGYPAVVAWRIRGSNHGWDGVQAEIKTISADSSAYTYSGTNDLFGFVTFAAGDTSKNVSVTFYGDYYYQNDRNLRFEVLDAQTAYDYEFLSGANYGPTNTDTSFTNGTPVYTDFTLLNDDITLSATGSYLGYPYSAYNNQYEGNNFVITINRSGRPDVAVKVDYSFTDGTAKAATDYTATAGSVTFGVSETVKYVTVAFTNDAVMEDTEAFTVNLTGALVDSTTEHAYVQFDQTSSAVKALTATIYDEDSQYTITAQSSNQNEYDAADSSTAAYVFKVDWASTGTSGAELVNAYYRVIGSGAKQADASDIWYLSSSSDWFRKDSGVTSRYVTVYINKDSIIEPDEGFKLEVWKETRSYSGVTNTFDSGTFVSSEQLILNDDRGIEIQKASVVEQDVDTNLVFTVLRTGSLSTTSTADWALNAGGNTADVTGVTSGHITFAPNIGTQYITITVVGDTLPEANEKVTINLSNLSNDVDNVESQLILAAEGTIVNDDSSFAVSAGAAAVEGSGQVFTITRTHVTSQDQVINWAVTATSQTDAGAEDFGESFPTGSVTFTGTELTRLVTITSSADQTKEDDEAFSFGISLGSGTTGDQITTSSVTGSILNDDTAYAITRVGAASANEGHSGVTNFVYTVTRSGNLTQPGTIDWAVSGAAVNAADFGLSSGLRLPGGTLTFAASVSTLLITVGVAGDLAVEGDEAFDVTLSAATGGSGGNEITAPSVTSTIANDDSTVSITAVTTSALEGNSGTTNFVYKLVRTGSLSGDASVSYSVAGSGSHAADVNADDFTGLTGNVALQNGVGTTFLTVQVKGDLLPEMDEDFTVTLSNGVGVLVDDGAKQASSTILADDTQFAIQVPANQMESGSFDYVVTRVGVTSAQQVLSWVIAGTGSSPASDADFTDYSGTLTFAAGATVATLAVGLYNDTELENDETFRLTFLPVSGATFLNGVRYADGTIIDDEVAYRITGSNLSRDEGQSGENAYVFTVTRQGQSVAGTVDWTLTAGSNFVASDLNPAALPTGGTLTFAATESSKTITITVKGDTTVEGDETFSIALTNAQADGVAATVAPLAGTVTAAVLNDDTDISIVAVDATKVEGHSGTTPFTFNIVRTGKLDAASVDYAITGTSIDANDIPLLSGSVALAANQATTTITVMVNGDRVAESDETFTVTLSNASSGVLRTPAANGTIQADDVVFDLTLQSPVSQAEGGAGTTTNFVYLVTRDGKLSGSQVLSWAVSGQGASQADPATDFVSSSGLVTFALNQLTAAITVGVKGDYTSEADEGFRLTLEASSGDDLPGVVFTHNTADATIVNDEASLYIAATETNKLEGQSGTASHVFTVTRTGNMNLPVTVNWALGTGDTDGSDFSGDVSGTLTFAATESTKLITLNSKADTDTESDEAFTVVLGGASTGANIITSTANGSIISDDQTWSIEAVRDIVTEGDTGTTSVVFRIIREGGQAATSIHWTASATGGAPADTADFSTGTFQYGNADFAQGQMTKLITVFVQGDSTFESDETFRVTLTPTSDGLTHNLLTSSADATIRNDDDVMNITATAGSIQMEGQTGQTGMVFLVTRSGSLSGNSTVGWRIDGLDSNGLTGSDFAATSGTVTFTDAQGTVSLTILANGDRAVELDETFTVALHTPGLGSTLGSNSTASGQILNDDVDLSISATTGSGLEGDTGDLANQSAAVGTAVFTINRTGDLSALTSVHWAVEEGTAVAADFPGGVLPSGNVTFTAGQSSATVTVSFAGDALDEGDQTFTVRLSGQSAEADIVTATANGTIANDDDSLAIVRYSTLSDAAEGNAGTSSYVFQVTRTGSTVGNASANWTVAGSGDHAVSNDEFVATTGSVSFTQGQSEAYVTVQVKGDTSGEYDEGFTVTLSQPSFGSTIVTAAASGTVVNDDPVITLVDDQPTGKAEGVNGASTAFTFHVIRSGNTTGASSVEWFVEPTGDAPTNAMDFGGAYPSGMVQFGEGQGTVVVTVEVLGDAAGELDETFSFKLRNAVNADILESEIASVKILNDDAGMYIEQVDSAAKPEGQDGASTDFVYKITRVFDLAPTSVNWAVNGVGDYQADGLDFVGGGLLPSGTISFANGVSVMYLTVAVQGDNVIGHNEEFEVTLSGNANLIVETARSTIINDDSLVALRSDATLSLAEGDAGTTAFVFTAVRSGATSQQAVVQYSVTGSGANPADASDFVGETLPTGLLTFAAGETTKTITIGVNGDTLAEANESFTLAISDNDNPGVTVDPSAARATATILGDDKGVLLFSANAVQTEGAVGEAKALTFRVLRTGDLSGDLALDYSIDGDVDSNDIVGGLTGSLTMAAGVDSLMLTIYTHGDADVELNESFLLSLSGTGITTAVASGMLLADDDGIVVTAPVTSVIDEGTGAGSTDVVFNVLAHNVTTERVVHWQLPMNAADGVETTDFVGGTSGYLTFSADGSQFVTVHVAQDSTIERDEMLRLDWSTDLGGGTTVEGSLQSGVRISNDDQPTAGNDSIEGSGAADVLSGMGGADTIRGYAGDDVVIVNSGDLQDGTLIDGGEGLDTIYFDVAGANLDLTQLLDNIDSADGVKTIERLDISGTGANRLTIEDSDLSSFGEIFDLDNNSLTHFKQLIVEGDANDEVVLVNYDGSTLSTVTKELGSYHVYQSPDIQVLINAQIHVIPGQTS